MDKVWALYDPASMIPIKISWKQPKSNYIEIDYELGLSFLSGTNPIQSYIIIEKDGKKTLEKRQPDAVSSVNFWGLSSIDDTIKGCTLFIKDNLLEVCINDDANRYILHATIKDNPSWLVRSWRLDQQANEKGYIELTFADAVNYSYYLRKIPNEA